MRAIPQVGSIVAERYHVLRAIGEGGMGAVFEAVNTRSGKRVAIKWLHPQFANDAEASERLVREARASCRVSHPNVVDIYDVVQEEGCLFLVMEYLEGEALSDWLRRGGGSLVELVRLLLGAMRGVAAAHQVGVIHRDINPANIFLARQPGAGAVIVPKVLDFGISKVLDDPAIGLTRSGVTMGTPMYMSYEQMLNARDIDARTDVYSFGVILYQAVTGHTPFAADTFAELVVKAGTGSVVPPKQLRPEIPTSLDRLICWTMERDRERRLVSMELLIQELLPFASEHAFRQQMTLAAHTLPAVGSAPPRKSNSSGSRRASVEVPGKGEVERESRVSSSVPLAVGAPRTTGARRLAASLAGMFLAIALVWLAMHSAPRVRAPVSSPKPSQAAPIVRPRSSPTPTPAVAAGVDTATPRGSDWSSVSQDAALVRPEVEVEPLPVPAPPSTLTKQAPRPSVRPRSLAKQSAAEPVAKRRAFDTRAGRVDERDFRAPVAP